MSCLMLDTNIINQCNEFVQDMNELSPYWHFKIVRFNNLFAIGTVQGFIFEKDLFKEDEKAEVNAIFALSHQGSFTFEIYLLESSEDDADVQKLKSLFKSGFEAAGAVAAAVVLRKDRELFIDDTGKSLAQTLGFL